MRKILLMFSLVAFVATNFSCKKEDDTPEPNMRVYVAGYEDTAVLSDVGTIWTDGIPASISDDTILYSVFVSENDVYTAGTEWNGTKYKAKVWKNGNATNLTAGNEHGYANSVFVLGDDVYVADYESNGTRNIAEYWKNDTAIELTNGNQNARAHSVFVKEN